MRKNSVQKYNKDKTKSEYLTAKIDTKYGILQITINEEGIVAQAEKHSDIGIKISEALLATYSDIIDIKTTIITDSYVVIEILINN